MTLKHDDYEIVYQETNEEGRFVLLRFSFCITSFAAYSPESLFVLLAYPIVNKKVFSDHDIEVPSSEYDDVYIIYRSYGDNVIRTAIGIIDQIKKDKKYSSRLE